MPTPIRARSRPFAPVSQHQMVSQLRTNHHRLKNPLRLCENCGRLRRSIGKGLPTGPAQVHTAQTAHVRRTRKKNTVPPPSAIPSASQEAMLPCSCCCCCPTSRLRGILAACCPPAAATLTPTLLLRVILLFVLPFLLGLVHGRLDARIVRVQVRDLPPPERASKSNTSIHCFQAMPHTRTHARTHARKKAGEGGGRGCTHGQGSMERRREGGISFESFLAP